MLHITIPAEERWDPIKEEFIGIDNEIHLTMEHSLISISKWEEIHHKAFLGKEKKTDDEILDYILCMVIQPQNLTIDTIKMIPVEEQKKINAYISDPASATVINENITRMMNRGKPRKEEVLTSEKIYYYMSQFNLPAEYQKWRLPRLLTLIELCNVEEWAKDPKNQKKLNFSGGTNMAKRYYEINKRRCEQMKTQG